MIGANQYTYDETPWQDEEVLREMYVEKGMGSPTIGDKLGCSNVTVLNWVEKFGIEKKTPNFEKVAPLMTTTKGYRYWQTRTEAGKESVFVHRLLAVVKFGFDAVCDMEVHHKNEFKLDNRPENLELMTKAEHAEHHGNLKNQ